MTTSANEIYKQNEDHLGEAKDIFSFKPLQLQVSCKYVTQIKYKAKVVVEVTLKMVHQLVLVNNIHILNYSSFIAQVLELGRHPYQKVAYMEISQFRSISVLPFLLKTLEKAANKQCRTFVDYKNLLHETHIRQYCVTDLKLKFWSTMISWFTSHANKAFQNFVSYLNKKKHKLKLVWEESG